MDWTSKIPVNFSQTPSILERLWAFIGHWDMRYYISGTAYIDLGAGSLGAMGNIKMAPPWTRGTLGSIGRYCAINDSAEIHAGGQHRNDLPVNVAFSQLPFFEMSGDQAPLEACSPVSVGSGVVISTRVIIRSGVKIGNGAVIGAGAIVTKDVEPYSVVVGNPAKELSKREPAQPWWDFAPAYHLANKASIQEVAASPGPHEWRKERPRLVLKVEGKRIDCLGFLNADTLVPLAAVPASVRDYLTQAFTDTPGVQPYWMADPWPD